MSLEKTIPQEEKGAIKVENPEDFLNKATSEMELEKQKVGPEVGVMFDETKRTTEDLAKIDPETFQKNLSKPEVSAKASKLGQLAQTIGGKAITGVSLAAGVAGTAMTIMNMVQGNIANYESMTSQPAGPAIAIGLMIGGFFVAGVSKAWRAESQRQRTVKDAEEAKKIKAEIGLN